MSNEELVAAIQAGAAERMGELWERVARLVKWKARHIMTALEGSSGRGVEFEDLCQSGYIALADAVESFDPAAGAVFSTWFMYHLKTAYATATGYRTKSGQNEPLDNALSLDKPLNDEPDCAAFGDLVPDAKAAATLLGVEEQLWQKQLHEAMDAALAELPEDYADMIRLRHYQGMTCAEAGELRGMTSEHARQMENKAIRQLRKPNIARILRPFYDFDCYCGTGLGAFRSSGMSVQERYLIAAEERTERKGGGGEVESP